MRAVLALLILPLACYGIIFEVPAGREECILENVEKGEEIEASYSIVETAHTEIDCTVKAPSGGIVVADLNRSSGKFDFVAAEGGTYELCFWNKSGKIGHKTVDLFFSKNTLKKLSTLLKKDNVGSLKHDLTNVQNSVMKVQFQEERLRQIHDQHINTVRDARRGLQWWTLLQCVAVLLISGVQILYLRKIFSGNRRSRLDV